MEGRRAAHARAVLRPTCWRRPRPPSCSPPARPRPPPPAPGAGRGPPHEPASVIDAPSAARKSAGPPELRPRAPAWRGVRRLLAIRMDNLGDVLMTSPALAAAAESVPGIDITLLGNAGAAALAPHLPMVRDVVRRACPGCAIRRMDPRGDDQALVADLAARRFDAA